MPHTMAKYKRADFAEEEDFVNVLNSSNDSNAIIGSIDNHHSKIHVRPIQPIGIWNSRSLLEKILILLTLGLLLLVVILFTLMAKGWDSWYVLHYDGSAGSDYNHYAINGKDLCLTPKCVGIASTMLDSMDLSVNPCNDFYQYACGGWIKRNPIPEGKSTWGTFQKLWEQNQLVIKTALESENKTAIGEGETKARKFYHSCLDRNETQEKLGSQPLIEMLNKIGGWTLTKSDFELSKWSFQTQLQVLHNEYNMGGLFTWVVGEDDKNSTRHVIQIDQGGLTLPTRDYYLNNSHANVVDAYLHYMTRIVVLLGAADDNATREGLKDIIRFETEIANITIPPEERRDDEKLYHNLTIPDLQKLAPTISWSEYFNNAFEKVNKHVTNQDVIVVYAPTFLSNMSDLLSSKLKTNKGKIVVNNYLVWHTVKALTCCLSKAFKDAEKILRRAILGSDGTEEIWRTCVTEVNNNMGFAVGALFIREAFHANSKPKAQIMIDEIRTAFQSNFWNLKWMDNETRDLAGDKAATITDLIGYPEFILNPGELAKKYEGLVVDENDYFGNNVRVSQYSLKKNLEKFGKEVNKTKWGMTPPTVNAYYTPTSNQMAIPAGILQYPFFDPEFPKSINFGAIGVVIGHEITHAFDDSGREYDKTGNLHQWWNNDTIMRFKKEAECIVNQYSSYKIEGETVNGNTTLGENIADNGGLKAAFHAYKKHDSSNDPLLPGLNLTHDQIFFLSFAQVWCSSNLKETLILQIQNDPHVPAPLRVRGPLSNLPDFSNTYKCPVGTTMNSPSKRCTLW